MLTVNVSFEDDEGEVLKEGKGDRTWRVAMLEDIAGLDLVENE